MMRFKEMVGTAALPGRARPADRVAQPAGTGQVLTFPVQPAARRRRSGWAGPVAGPVTAVVAFKEAGALFTLADHAALYAWIGRPDHGYARLHVERGAASGTSFALVYRADAAWAVWGLARQHGAVEAWRCATGETVGRFLVMADALASLPHASACRRT